MKEATANSNLKQQFEKYFKGDPVIWFVVFTLAILSVLTVYSAAGTLAFKKHHGNTEYFLIKQLLFVGISLFVMWLAHLVDYRYYSKISRFALIISVPFLLFSFFFGSKINDASRWLTIPIINQTFQPSDLAKFALIANLAAMLAKHQGKIDDIKNALIPMLLWCGAICGLIALSNMSTAMMMFATCLLLMYIGRVPLKYLAMLMLIGRDYRKRTWKQYPKKFPTSPIFRFYLRYHHRRIRSDWWNRGSCPLPHAALSGNDNCGE